MSFFRGVLQLDTLSLTVYHCIFLVVLTGILQILAFGLGFVAQDLRVTFSILGVTVLVLALVSSDPSVLCTVFMMFLGGFTALADVQQASRQVAVPEVKSAIKNPRCSACRRAIYTCVPVFYINKFSQACNRRPARHCCVGCGLASVPCFHPPFYRLLCDPGRRVEKCTDRSPADRTKGD